MKVLLEKFVSEKHLSMEVLRFTVLLTHFMTLVSFYTSLIYHKTSGFLMFSGGIEKEQRPEMG